MLPVSRSQRVHYQRHIAICGNEGDKNYASTLNDVDCPHCIELLKEKNWYCENCGFIDNANVTDEEICDICGSEVE